MTANGLSAAELAEAVSRGASGMDTAEAVIRLLVAHGVWPVRLAAARFVDFPMRMSPRSRGTRGWGGGMPWPPSRRER